MYTPFASVTVRRSTPVSGFVSSTVMGLWGAPAASVTPTAPKRFSVITRRASFIGVVSLTRGTSAPVCIKSETVRSIAPSFPPG